MHVRLPVFQSNLAGTGFYSLKNQEGSDAFSSMRMNFFATVSQFSSSRTKATPPRLLVLADDERCL